MPFRAERRIECLDRKIRPRLDIRRVRQKSAGQAPAQPHEDTAILITQYLDLPEYFRAQREI